MSLAKEYEDLRIWQDARKQTKEIYGLMDRCRDYSFKDQIQRAAVSVMNNIAEGFERETRPDFQRFLGIAKGSCGEVRSMLYLAEDLKYLEAEKANEMRGLSKQLSKSIKAFSNSLG